MRDPFGREVTNLRLSVTQRCNLNCVYCHGEGEVLGSTGEMTASEIGRIVQVASQMGMHKLKLTGGEPLMRSDLSQIISSAGRYMGEVSLTTNGTLLAPRAAELKEAGLDRVNISLDTLDPAKYRQITGKDCLGEVLDGVEAAVRSGLRPVKLNTVVLAGINEREIERMIAFSKEAGVILQLIEFESGFATSPDESYHYDLHPIEEELARRAIRVKERRMQRRKKYWVPNEVEVVRGMHNTRFCANCTRIRVTSDGKIKPCLLRNDNLVDILTPLRSGASDTDLTKRFEKAISLREPYWR